MKRPSLVTVMTLLGVLLAWHQGAVFPSYAGTKNELVFFDLHPDVYQTGVKTDALVTANLKQPGVFDLTSASVQKCDVSGGQVVVTTCKHFGKLIARQTSPTDLQGKFTLQFAKAEGTIAFRIKISVTDIGSLISPPDILLTGQLVTADQNATSDVTVTSTTDPALKITLQQNSVSEGGVLVAVEPAPTTVQSIGAQPVEATVDVTLVSIAPEAPPVTKPALLLVPVSTAPPDGTKYWFVTRAEADRPGGGQVRQFLTIDTGTAQGGVVRTDNGTDPTASAPSLRSTNRLLQGLFEGGEVILARFVGTGAAQGVVCPDSVADSAACIANSTARRRHVWVREMLDANGALITQDQGQGFFSNVDGDYIVPIAGSDYRVQAIDGFRCASGESASGSLSGQRTLVSPGTGGGADNSLAIVLNQPHAPTRFGMRNPGFELAFSQERCWRGAGASELGDTDSAVTRITGAATPSITYLDLFGFGTTIRVSEKDLNDATATVPVNNAMAAIVANGGSIQQSFMVPKGVDSLLFDFNFGCLASNTTCGDATALRQVLSRLNIELQAELTLPAGSTRISDGTPVSSISFAQGAMRNFNGQLGWRTGKLDGLGNIQVPNPTEPLAGSQRPVTVTFTARNLDTNSTDLNPNTLDAAILLDNIRFQDVVLTVHILSGAGTSPDQVRDQVRALNEIGTQTGKLVRIRRINDPVSPTTGSPADVCKPSSFPATWADSLDTEASPLAATIDVGGNAVTRNVRTPEITALMCFGAQSRQPGDPASDIQVYYVKKFDDDEGGFGLAITGEDYWGNEPNRQSPSPTGLIVADLINLADTTTTNMRKFETAFHELGHKGIDAYQASTSVEHLAAFGNIMTKASCEPVRIFVCPDGTATCEGFHTEAVTLCSSRPMVNSTQSDEFDAPAPPKPGRCLEGC